MASEYRVAGRKKPFDALRQGKTFRRETLVRKEGVEPPRPCGHRILSPARLPVPPLPHSSYYTKEGAANHARSNPGETNLREWQVRETRSFGANAQGGPIRNRPALNGRKGLRQKVTQFQSEGEHGPDFGPPVVDFTHGPPRKRREQACGGKRYGAGAVE